eukprot:2712992-Pyramimonas_sp.AAC.1
MKSITRLGSAGISSWRAAVGLALAMATTVWSARAQPVSSIDPATRRAELADVSDFPRQMASHQPPP